MCPVPRSQIWNLCMPESVCQICCNLVILPRTTCLCILYFSLISRKHYNFSYVPWMFVSLGTRPGLSWLVESHKRCAESTDHSEIDFCTKLRSEDFFVTEIFRISDLVKMHPLKGYVITVYHKNPISKSLLRFWFVKLEYHNINTTKYKITWLYIHINTKNTFSITISTQFQCTFSKNFVKIQEISKIFSLG